VVPPRIEGAFPNPRLAHVIQNEDLLRMAVHELNGLGKVPFKNQDVVDQLGRSEGGYSSIKVWTKNVLVIGFVLNDVAQPFEFRSSRELLEAGRKINVG
jgi:hypothetical protein